MSNYTPREKPGSVTERDYRIVALVLGLPILLTIVILGIISYSVS